MDEETWSLSSHLRKFKDLFFRQFKLSKGPLNATVSTSLGFSFIEYLHVNIIFVKTQRNSTQHNSTHPPHHAQTFQPLLDQLESWNLARPLTRQIWLKKHNLNPTNYRGREGGHKPFPQD